MFIPAGTTIHESLATSYVLVDALVADLCEGGFSGIVEVVLRDTDNFIVIASGGVAAVIENRGGQTGAGATASCAQTTVEAIAERSRRERGRVSVHGYSAATADAVAGRINAQPLYVGLSTEFTDLEKMISKLVREPDREWFIEMSGDAGPSALIHMRDSECHIVSSRSDPHSGALDLAGNAALGHLLDECTRAGSAFDVYFRLAAGTDGQGQRSAVQPVTESTPVEAATISGEPYQNELSGVQPVDFGQLFSDDLYAPSSAEAQQFAVPGAVASSPEHYYPAGDWNVAAADIHRQPGLTSLAEAGPLLPADDAIEDQAGALSLLRDEVPEAADGARAMAEIKRLMGEIARAIEEAAQAVGRPDNFSMSLRAGLLKVADRYPFLDPFAGDFEYLAGEIVFVGSAPAEEFVAGLTEALKLAIEAVTRSTAYADRFRSYVAGDLQKLLARERDEFERFGLDQVIERMIAA